MQESTKRIAVLGTDTEVGKTYIGAQIVRCLVESGLRVAAFKPLESGIVDNGGVPADASALRHAAGAWQSLDAVCPWPLPNPVTPAEELRRLGIDITRDELVAAAASAGAGADVLWIETAGGPRSPLTSTLTSLDLAQLLDARPILVASNRLGCINHTSLAYGAIEAACGPPLVLLNRFGVSTTDRDSNARWLRHLHPEMRLFEVGITDGLPAIALAAVLAEVGVADR